MPALDVPEINAFRDHGAVRGSGPAATWRPASADDALAVLDRIARYCVYSCAVGTERCLEDPCEARQLERAASGYLAGRWLDAQD
jgi:hypothetical protein